jgi:hypothetical protein
MNINRSCVVSAIALFAGFSAHAADADKASVTRLYRDVVDPKHQADYEAGVKTYNKCLAEHGLKYTWIAWGHETGNVYMYSYAAGPYMWSDFDTMHAVTKPCDQVWRTAANPYLQGEISVFTVDMPELGYMPKEREATPALISVTLFTLSDLYGADDAFADAMKKIAAAAHKSKWTRPYSVLKTKGGDKDAPDYILLSPYKNWAAFGAGADPTVWKMVEGVYGKDDTEALRKSLNGALKDVSQHVDSYNEELTYIPPKK